jgi:hypothetical protein
MGSKGLHAVPITKNQEIFDQIHADNLSEVGFKEKKSVGGSSGTF